MSTEYHILQGQPEGVELRGGALALWKCKDPEVMLSGPAETGKTFGGLNKLDALMWKYAGAQAAIIRKTRQSMDGSVLQTYRNVIGKDSPINPYGGSKPEWYDYPNGSRIYVGGMDNPGKVLSSERDFIYVNQAEELSVNDWETVITRVTGRAANAPYAQLFGDCNPWTPTHWIKQRPSLRIFESRHEDNPTLFTADGQITERGVKSMRILDSLTGTRYYRLRKGLWVSAEGVVYEEYDPAIHLISAMPAGWEAWPKYRAIDFGYTNPFVCQWWAVDPDGRAYLYREIYMTGRTVAKHAADIKRHSEGERYVKTITDHDAEDRATLHEHSIPTEAAKKAVRPGIDAVKERLVKAGDGRPRLYILRGALVERDESLAAQHLPCCTEEEFPEYVWVKTADGKPNKEEPNKMYDHGMDPARYLVMELDQPTPPFRAAAGGQRTAFTGRR